MDAASAFDENRRLAALHALRLLDSDPQAEFDSLVALAAEMMGVPTALITLIDRDRQWIKARKGFDRTETPRKVAFCDHTIRNGGLMVVADASRDPRFSDNPLVTGGDHVRFYAGMPIHAHDPDGQAQPVGALCVIDRSPRSLDERGERALRHLAALAEALIDARATAIRAIDLATESNRMAGELAIQDRIFRQAERLAMIGSWRLSLVDDRLDWSDGVYRIHGLPPGDNPPIDTALRHYPPPARARVADALARTIDRGEPFDIEEDFLDADGRRRRVRALAEVEQGDGVPTAIVGVFQDVTDRFTLETRLRHLADTDALTGLANRAAFDRTLEAAMARARDGDAPLALALIDLDGFKAINDTLGHTAGDDVLRSVGRVLRADWLRGSFAARLGGDEFALIVDHPALIADADGLRQRLEMALQLPVAAGPITMASGGTIGIAAYAGCATVRDFVHHVDTLLYAAKRARVGERRRGDRRRAANG